MATSQNQRMLSAVACEIGWIPTESRTTLFRAPPAGASNPVIQGEVSGVEVRAQFLPCEAAVFTGTCDCIVDDRNAPGFFWVLCRMIHFQMLVSLQRSIAANGISLHYGPAFLVRSSVVKSSTRAIIRSKSPLGFVFKKVAGIVTFRTARRQRFSPNFRRRPYSAIGRSRAICSVRRQLTHLVPDNSGVITTRSSSKSCWKNVRYISTF